MTSRLSSVWPALERVAREAGVLRIGASDLEDAHRQLFAEWIDAGRQAAMHYLDRNRQARLDPRSRFPWARSVVVVLVPYAPERPQAPAGALSNHVARYAQGDDYHDVVDAILRRLEDGLREADASIVTRRYVDTGPLSDRAYAAQGGLGWIGRNGMLIDPDHGSWVFIGTLLTSLENDIAAEEVADRCGSCTRCLEACPTAAILPDRTVESSRCLSYATIEHRGELPDLALAGNAFGCDICQEVCPWNHFDARRSPPPLAPRKSASAWPSAPNALATRTWPCYDSGSVA